ncbi:hypothetical protein [Roseobacter denitrificans]|nr:hypothetical protein [Roseobacter denitrificans]SFF92529.1 hypothetical protein SAMN05443635_1046 [Roseobacter denitrificans OCh 114]
MLKRLLCLSLLGQAACSTTANLYPVSGPMSQQSPVPTLVATVDGITGNTGGFSFSMPTGAVCTGKWSSVAPQSASVTTGSLFSQFGSVAGYSTTVGNVPGVNKGQAFATCSDNTRFDVEFFTGSGTANGYGIAKDTNGNVYKMLF